MLIAYCILDACDLMRVTIFLKCLEIIVMMSLQVSRDKNKYYSPTYLFATNP